MTSVFVYEHVTATSATQVHPPSLLAEARAMRDAVAADLAAVPGVRVLAGDDFDAAARADSALVIAPESDGILERLARRVVAAGGRLLGPSADAIRLTADKCALAERLHRAGIATPTTVALADAARLGYPQVWKPRDGAGSQATFFVASPAEGEGIRGELDWPGPMIAQEFVAGVAASVAFLVGPDALVPLVPCRQLLSRDGRFAYLGGETPLAPALAKRAERVASAAAHAVSGLLGYVGVDVVLGGDGRDFVVEINPRLTTSYVGLRALAETNLVATMLAVAAGDSFEPIRWRAGRVAFRADGTV